MVTENCWSRLMQSGGKTCRVHRSLSIAAQWECNMYQEGKTAGDEGFRKEGNNFLSTAWIALLYPEIVQQRFHFHQLNYLIFPKIFSFFIKNFELFLFIWELICWKFVDFPCFLPYHFLFIRTAFTMSKPFFALTLNYFNIFIASYWVLVFTRYLNFSFS